MSRPASYRGQPVLVLAVLLAGWIAVRVALWEPPFVHPTGPAELAPLLPPAAAPADAAPRPAAPAPAEPQKPAPRAPRAPFWLEPVEPASPPSRPLAAAETLPQGWGLAAKPPAFDPVRPRVAGGQLLLLAAAFSNLEVPPELAALVAHGRAVPAAIPPFPQQAVDSAPSETRRWSGDGWLLLRKDTTTPITSGRGSYGRSQVGAVLRYRLVPDSGHRPAAYLRASAALAGPREVEAAIGVSARPLAALPIVAAGEVRASRYGERVEARPAAFAYSEFPPLELPLGVRGEAYLQAGYVGGRFHTGFVDGQVRVDREVARLGPAELRAGGGAWGGAQKGAKRLDIGPGATVAVELGGSPLRMSADWRFRVAGEANPASGPALTVSTGF